MNKQWKWRRAELLLGDDHAYYHGSGTRTIITFGVQTNNYASGFWIRARFGLFGHTVEFRSRLKDADENLAADLDFITGKGAGQPLGTIHDKNQPRQTP